MHSAWLLNYVRIVRCHTVGDTLLHTNSAGCAYVIVRALIALLPDYYIISGLAHVTFSARNFHLLMVNDK